MRYEALRPDPWEVAGSWFSNWEFHDHDMHILHMPPDGVRRLVGELMRRAQEFEYGEGPFGRAGERRTSIPALFEDIERYTAGDAKGNLNLRVVIDGLPLYPFIWAGGRGCYDVEVVVWPDRVFPPDASTSRHQSTFRSLVQLGLDLCNVSGARRLVLTDGCDPGECSARKEVTVWQTASPSE